MKAPFQEQDGHFDRHQVLLFSPYEHIRYITLQLCAAQLGFSRST
jgi:hypothetical protein